MSSVTSGQITFGGAGFGAVTGDVTLDDGSSWSFAGYMGILGTPNVGYGNVQGSFSGESHMAGSCAFEITDGGLGPGGFQITWFDLHGTIGTVYGYCFGGGAAFGLGGGTWTEKSGVLSAEQESALEKKAAELEAEK